jgi:CubicO group peptidase (beta-lactamase class C family)
MVEKPSWLATFISIISNSQKILNGARSVPHLFMQKTISSLFLFLSIIGCQSSPTKKNILPSEVSSEPALKTTQTTIPVRPKGPSQPTFPIEEQIKNIRFATGIPGLSVLAVDQGPRQIFIHDGFRKWGSSDFIQENDRWHLATNTQAMTSYILAQLHQQKILDLEKPLNTYLSFQIQKEHRSLKLIDLLRHQTKLQDALSFSGGTLWKNLWSTSKTAPQLRVLLSETLLKAQGRKSETGFNFNHANYVIAASIAEAVTGKPWESLVHQYIFVPQKMKTCAFGAAGDARLKNADQPWPHFEKDKKIQFVPPGPEADNPPALRPAVGVHCSLQDWSQFISILEKEYRQKGILDPVTLKLLFEESQGSRFVAAGWSRSENDWSSGPVFSHDGTNGLNFSSAVWAPETGKRILFATNIGGPRGSIAAIEALRILMNSK